MGMEAVPAGTRPQAKEPWRPQKPEEREGPSLEP